MDATTARRRGFPFLSRVALCVSMAVLVAAAGPVGAATIVGSFTGVTNNDANTGSDDDDFSLTDLGTEDWAYWVPGTATGNPLAPTSAKAGASLISDMVPVSGDIGDTSVVRGSTSAYARTANDFFVDGSLVTTNAGCTGGFNSRLDHVGNGVGITVTLPTTDLYAVHVWVGMFGDAGGQGLLTASLTGAGDFTDTSLVVPGASGDAAYTSGHSGFYTLTVQADSPGDALTVTYVLSADSGATYDRTQIAGVAIAAVPEPTTLTLVAAGLLGLVRRRRR